MFEEFLFNVVLLFIITGPDKNWLLIVSHYQCLYWRRAVWSYLVISVIRQNGGKNGYNTLIRAIISLFAYSPERELMGSCIIAQNFGNIRYMGCPLAKLMSQTIGKSSSGLISAN